MSLFLLRYLEKQPSGVVKGLEVKSAVQMGKFFVDRMLV